MNSAELLTSLIRKKNAKRGKVEAVSEEDDIGDITFLLHWFPQFSIEDLLEMPYRRFNALLKNAKADHLQDHLQQMVGFSVAKSPEGEKYAREVSEEINRLRR